MAAPSQVIEVVGSNLAEADEASRHIAVAGYHAAAAPVYS